MEQWQKDFLEELREKRTTYLSMIEFCCDDLILNNTIVQELGGDDYYFDLYCGNDYDDENDYSIDIYQYYIIDEQGAQRLADYTNEIVYYCEKLDLYLLGVTHWGTSWSIVPSNWKEVEGD